MDGEERPAANGPRGRADPDDGYRAAVRLRATDGRTTRLAVAGLIALVGIGVVASLVELADPGAAPNDETARSSATSTLTDSPAAPATSLPVMALLGQPFPDRPIPIATGWLRWLDPTSAILGGDMEPADGQWPTFVDAEGRAVSLCATASDVPHAPDAPDAQATVTSSTVVRLCTYNQLGQLQTNDLEVAVISTWPVGPPNYYGTAAPLQLDATVSRDGRWLWLVSAAAQDLSWNVDLVRVDLAAHAASPPLRVREIPIGSFGSPSPEGWLVSATTSIFPVVRASPAGRMLSITLTAHDDPATGSGLLQQERIELDGSLSPSFAVRIAFPAGAASDIACDPRLSAWATDRHYLTICRHPEANGDVQPFARIENPGDMTRDVAVGPRIPASVAVTGGDASWLLDATRGVLYRWAPSGPTLTSLDVATRGGSTVILDRSEPAASYLPRGAALDGEPLAWTPLQPNDAAEAGHSLVGSADGSILYAVRPPSTVRGIRGADRQSVVWAIDPERMTAIARWFSPGPIDQLALAPGDGPLVELVTPSIPRQPIPAPDWVTALWLVDRSDGRPLEVLGRIRGPGNVLPVLPTASVASFANPG